MADGTIVEGRGVIPDLPVAVRRSDLAAGIDPVLRAAIEYILAAD
jgi:C-terminal processing protease CtpA/Prc